MKKFYLVIVALCLSVVAHGQLQPPVQSDTLVIQSVKYNYSDIRKENWPCNIIVKSTTSFRFGDQVVNIKDAREGSYDYKLQCGEIIFRMEDNKELSYYEKGSTSFIVYSGYKFECKNNLSPMVEVSSSNGIILEGRTVVGTIAKPEYNVKESGTVVVSIWVDTYGNVVKVEPGAGELPLIIPNYGVRPEKLHLQHASIPMTTHLYSNKELLHMFLNCID